MRPERRKPDRPFGGAYVTGDRTALPFEAIDDPAVARVKEVDRRLTDPGRRARAELGDYDGPDPTFASGLRERLLLQLPAGAATGSAAAPSDRMAPGWVVAPAAEAGSRRSRGTNPTVRNDLAIGAVGFAPTDPMREHGRPQRVIGPLTRTGPRLATPQRWAVAMAAAVFIVGALGLGPGRGLFAVPAPGILATLLASEPPSTGTPTPSPEPTDDVPATEPSIDPSPIETPRPAANGTPKPTPGDPSATPR